MPKARYQKVLDDAEALKEDVWELYNGPLKRPKSYIARRMGISAERVGQIIKERVYGVKK